MGAPRFSYIAQLASTVTQHAPFRLSVLRRQHVELRPTSPKRGAPLCRIGVHHSLHNTSICSGIG
jgi:hypothetical protein